MELGVVESIKTVGKKCLHWVKCTLATGRMDGWMDGQAFKVWVQLVVQPYVAAQDNRVYSTTFLCTCNAIMSVLCNSLVSR